MDLRLQVLVIIAYR